MSAGKANTQLSGPERSRSGLTVIEIVVIVIIILVLVALLYPAIQSSGIDSGRRNICRNNLKQLGLSLHNYHEKYDSFPPAYVVGDNGRPLYSWRVLILPFLDQQYRYNQLHLDEPWDSPHNRPLLDVDLPLFRCPTDEKATKDSDKEVGRGMTNYVAVVGPESVWPAPDACSIGDISDGTSNTILVVEVAGSGIHWAEPRDLHVMQMSPDVNPSSGMGLSSRHEGGTHVLLADGSARFIADDTPREMLWALLTRAGGETIDGDW